MTVQQHDNELAAAVKPGATVRDAILGVVVLGKHVGQNSKGWDLYEIRHSGHVWQWSSAVVHATFARGSDLR